MKKERCPKCDKKMDKLRVCYKCDGLEESEGYPIAQEIKNSKLRGKRRKEYLNNLPHEDKIAYHKYEVARRRKHLLPINIIVAVLSLVSCITLIFTPFVKVDFGKAVGSDGVKTFLTETISDATQDATSDAGDDAVIIDPSAIIMPILTTFLDEMKTADISLSLSAFDALRDSGENGADKLKTIITDAIAKISTNLINTIKTTLTKDEVKTTITNTLVDTVSTMLAKDAGLPSEKITEKKAEITNVVNGINGVKSVAEMEAVADDFCNLLDSIAPEGETLTAEDKKSVKDEMVKLYNDTMDKMVEAGVENPQFSVEALLSSVISENLDPSEIDKLFGVSEGDGDATASLEVSTFTTDGGTEGETTSQKNIVFTYADLIETLDTEKITNAVKSMMEEALASANDSLVQFAQIYSYIGYGFLAFAGLWFILFLFSFLRIFAKNRRFVTWYVKLLCWIPCLIWLMITLAGSNFLWDKIGGLIGGEEMTSMIGLITGLLGGISSFTWISGLSLVLIWLISCNWAFTVKHKIRKHRKPLKKERKRLKKEAKAEAKMMKQQG